MLAPNFPAAEATWAAKGNDGGSEATNHSSTSVLLDEGVNDTPSAGRLRLFIEYNLIYKIIIILQRNILVLHPSLGVSGSVGVSYTVHYVGA